MAWPCCGVKKCGAVHQTLYCVKGWRILWLMNAMLAAVTCGCVMWRKPIRKWENCLILTEINSFDVEWTRNMVDLSTSGCYYQYLSEKYPAEEVQALYISGDYSQLSSETFEAEVAFFESWLRMIETSQEMDAEVFVEQMDRLLEMNRLFFADMMGWEYKLDIYYALDQARLGLWRNDVRYAMVRMTTASAMLGLTTNTVELTPTPEDTSEPSAGPTSTPKRSHLRHGHPGPTWTPRPTNAFLGNVVMMISIEKII